MAAKPNELSKRKKKRKARGVALASLTGAGIALIGVYVGFGIYYNNHYFPHTTIGDIPCGNQTANYVESQNIDNASDYLLTLYDRKGTKFHLAGMDFSYAYDATGEEASILSHQNGFLWPVEIFRKHPYELDRSFTYDSSKLQELIDAMEIFQEDYIVNPQNAYIDITDDTYKVVNEVEGNAPIKENVTEEITTAINEQKTKLTLSDNCYQKPEITANDKTITNLKAQIDAYTAATIHYTIDGADANLDSSRILQMLNISKDGKVSINEDKVTSFVQHLASTYNTYGDVRDSKTSKGDTVKIGGGDYGWVINKAKEKEEILKDLKNGKPVEREPVYEQTAIQSGTDDIGDTYIELDYTNQHMWFYKKGKLVLESDFVSGNLNRNNGSPDGVFKIVYRQKDATLVGENYASNVNYFMPFAYNVGLHDASWRSTFGGEIYKTSGSHGCINLPEKIAKKLYDKVDVGTPVIAFYREKVTLTAENARISNAYSYKDPDKE